MLPIKPAPNRANFTIVSASFHPGKKKFRLETADQVHELLYFTLFVLNRNVHHHELIQARGEEFLEALSDDGRTARDHQALDEGVGHCALGVNRMARVSKHREPGDLWQ